MTRISKKLSKNINKTIDKKVLDTVVDTNDVVAFDDVEIRTNNLLSPINMRILENYSIGYSSSKAVQLAGFVEDGVKYISRLLATEAGRQYYNNLLAKYQKESFITKEQVIKELMVRLSSAKDADAVNIIKTLNSLMGWEEKKDNDITINLNWGDDPWK